MSHKSMSRQSMSRRNLVKAGLGVGAAGLLLPKTSLPVLAQDYPALGTWPAGTSGTSIFVGGIFPLTGPYSASGKDQQLGFELAIEHLNNGSRITDAIPSLKKGGGVLGKKIDFAVGGFRDQAEPRRSGRNPVHPRQQGDRADRRRQQRRSIALMKLGQREHVIYMVGNSGSNDTTGKDCQRYGFRAQPSAYMAAKALAPVLAKAARRGRARPRIWCPTTPTAPASTTR